ncbi:MAG: FHA domain-containing protein [Fimbriimonadales bacterium]
MRVRNERTLEPLVSRLHARLTVEAGQLVIYDLNSTNGTTVNGVKVQRHALQAGDIVEIGESQLQVSAGA